MAHYVDLSRRGFLSGAAVLAGATAVGGSLAGCGSSTGAAAGGTTTLTFVAPGDAPTGWSRVLSAVNNKLLADKTGLQMSIQWLPWSNFLNQVLLEVTSGASFDGVLTATWAHMQQFITEGAIIPVDSYLSKTPHLTATIPELAWKSNKINGKSYAVPLMSSYMSYYGFMIRKDLRVKYGMAPITSLAQMQTYLYKVKANEKDMIPFGFNSAEQTVFDAYRWENEPWAYHGLTYNTNYNIGYIDITDPKNPRMVDLWDYPGFIPMIRTHYDYVQAGLINRDSEEHAGADIDSLFQAGKYAGEQVTTDGTLQPAEAMQVPGAELEIVYPFGTATTPKVRCDFQAWNFLGIHNTSPNASKVMALMDWLSIRENHDLLEYGISGQDWTAPSIEEYTPKSGYDFPGYVISWRPDLERVSSTMIPEELSWYDWARNPASFTYDPYGPFLLDTTSINSEIEQLSSLETQYFNPLLLGLTDPVSGLSTLKSAFESAGYAQVQAEAQKQVTAFAATL
jgi:putative aldouronate transport system substrate-binding protein